MLDKQLRQSPGGTLQLLENDVISQMVLVEVAVAKGMNKFPHFQIALLGNHVGQQSVRGDVEWHAEEQIRAALVELAR